MTENICFSGGAVGADMAWGAEALKQNHNVIHYSFPGHNVKNTPLNTVYTLSIEDLKEADPYLIEANRLLQRHIKFDGNYIVNLMRRNYFQIKFAESIYAIGSIDNGKIPGGTAWAITMGILKGMDNIFIFDQVKNNW